MAKDPYQSGMFKSNPYAKKVDIKGNLLVVLDGKYEERGLSLMKPISRAVLSGEIHELIITDEMEAAPGAEVNKIAYLGFFEVEQAGVIVSGDEVWLEDKLVGNIVGFDETHMPNHLNIVLKSPNRISGLEQKAELGMKLTIKK